MLNKGILRISDYKLHNYNRYDFKQFKSFLKTYCFER